MFRGKVSFDVLFAIPKAYSIHKLCIFTFSSIFGTFCRNIIWFAYACALVCCFSEPFWTEMWE